MAMDLRKIKKLIDLTIETGIAEIEVHEGEESVRICRYATPQPVGPTTITLPSDQVAIASSVPNTNQAVTTPTATPLTSHTLKSPMVGTAYLAATPGAKPFVEVGQHVKEGDIICLIEAMKMYNPIEADKTGAISARLIENGQPVEYGQDLFIIE